MKTPHWNQLLLFRYTTESRILLKIAARRNYKTFKKRFIIATTFALTLFDPKLYAQEHNIEANKNKQTSVFVAPEISSWSFMHPYSARYLVSSDGSEIGYSNRELSQSDSIWQLSTDASVSKYFLKMTSRELSRFALIDRKLKTLEFDSKTKISFKKERHMNQVFNWQTGIEIGKKDKKSWQLEHSKLAYDRVSHLVQLRADLLSQKQQLTYNVSYKGKLHEYGYEHQGKEIISTKMGKLESLKFSRTKSNGDVFIVWMSPELNYFPIKIAQLEDDKPDITMTLESLEYISTTSSTEAQSNKLEKTKH